MVLTCTVAGHRFTFEAADVERAVAGVLPEPLSRHFVAISGRRYPPKQALALLTGLDRTDFTTRVARVVLQRAGFTVGRVEPRAGGAPRPEREAWPHQGREAEALRPYQGRWVAQRGLEILVAADGARDVVGWLNEHAAKGATVFRVPVTAAETEVGWPR